jgi:hypothetical protein
MLNWIMYLRCGNVCWIRQNVLGSFATSLKKKRRWINKNSTKITFCGSAHEGAVYNWWKKSGLPEIAHKIVEDLKWDFNVTYDEKDAVGRRYRRQDALGTHVLYYGSSNDRGSNCNYSSPWYYETRPCKITDLNAIIENEVSMKTGWWRCNYVLLYVIIKGFQMKAFFLELLNSFLV